MSRAPHGDAGMSFSVDYGFRFRTDDLLEVHRLLTAYRAEVRRMSREFDTRLLAGKAVALVDRAALSGRPVAAPLSLAWEDVFDRRRGIARGEPAPEVDVTFFLAVIPWEGRVYGSVHTWRSEWARHLVGQPWAEPYDYTDACDQDAVPQHEYDARGGTWKAIARQDPGWRLAGCGFKVDFLPDHSHIPPEEVLAAAPGMEARVRNAARDAVIAARASEMRAEGVDPMRAAVQACLWYTDPESAERARAEAERISSLLPVLDVQLLKEGVRPVEEGVTNPGGGGGT